MSVFFKGVKILILLSFILNSIKGNAQFYNKEVKASIKVDQTSEFTTFTAISENLTILDYSLRYEFMTFNTDSNNNNTKEVNSNNFYLKRNEKQILGSISISNNHVGKIILVLFIYNTDNKPIGKDRVLVEGNGKGLKITLDNYDKPKTLKPVSKDQDTSNKDGLFLEGLVLKKTLTKVGKDFYKYFYSEYYNKQIKTIKNILIKEIPGQRRNTQIVVSIEDQIVLQFFSRPDKSYLKQMASYALTRCISHLQSLQMQDKSLIQY